MSKKAAKNEQEKPKKESQSKLSTEVKELASGASAETCGQCKRTFESDDEAVLCELCGIWFHITCQDLPEGVDIYKLLSLETIHWFCKSCNNRAATLLKSVVKLQEKHEKLENELLETKSNVARIENNVVKILEATNSLEQKVNKIEDVISKGFSNAEETAIEAKLINSLKKEFEPTFAQVLAQTNTMETRVKEFESSIVEVQDREKRSHNIMIYRAPEQETVSDKAFCLELFNEALETNVNEDDLKGVFRVGKKGTDPRPIVVQFREKHIKNKVFDCLFKLGEAEEKFKNLSISHDLSPKEREECKALVEQAKEKEKSEPGDFIWRVRGLPGQLRLVKIKRKEQLIPPQIM